jgi:hypothetical protein
VGYLGKDYSRDLFKPIMLAICSNLPEIAHYDWSNYWYEASKKYKPSEIDKNC